MGEVSAPVSGLLCMQMPVCMEAKDNLRSHPPFETRSLIGLRTIESARWPIGPTDLPVSASLVTSMCPNSVCFHMDSGYQTQVHVLANP